MERIYLILFMILLIGCSKNISETETNQQIDTLKYEYNGFNNGGTLFLFSNGEFQHRKYIYGCTGGGENKVIFGDYKIKNSTLYLNDKKIKLEIFPYIFDEESKVLKLDVVPDSLKLSNEFHMIKWNKNEYLLSDKLSYGWSLEKENDFIRFSNNYNSGYEPKNSGMYLKKEGIKSDIEFEELDLSQIPLKWKDLFLVEPVFTKISSSVAIKNKIIDGDTLSLHWLVELDKGSKDFVRKGMSFSTEDGDTFFSIDSISENSCYAKVFEYEISDIDEIKIGKVFKTKWN